MSSGYIAAATNRSMPSNSKMDGRFDQVGPIVGLTIATMALVLSLALLAWYIHWIRKQSNEKALSRTVSTDGTRVASSNSYMNLYADEEWGKRYDPDAESEYSQPGMSLSRWTAPAIDNVDFDQWGKPISRPPPAWTKPLPPLPRLKMHSVLPASPLNATYCQVY